jgi:Cu+-exporting ATPase
MESIRFKVEGMSCASCAAGIEKLSSKVDGIKACEVNYAMETAYLEVDSSESIATFKRLLKDNGYGLLEDDSSLEKKSESKDIAFKFIVGFIFSILIFSLEMGPLKNTFDRNTNWLLQFFLASPIWIWIGASFQSSVLSFIRTGHSNMNTLIGIGTSAAYLYSSFLILFPELSLRVGLSQKVYFEAVGFIISFVYLGKFFEEKAKRKTKEALNALFSLSAKQALKVEDGEVVTISQSDVAIGDVLRVLPGAVIPVDGKLTKGSSYVDESMISGEPIPVFKNAGDEVFAGTINSDGSFDYRATKVGKDTFLAKIIEFVESAQSSKPKIQRYADKIGGIFTPVVIIIAVLTFALWMIFGAEPLWGNSVSNFIAVLVIACPCALGLATPTAVVVATGRASLKGLLIGGGEVLEKAVGVNAVVFDKTGTLTKGKPEVIEYVESESGLLRAASSIEQFSEHPLSKAIINFSSSKKLSLGEPDSFEVVKGKGIESHFEGDDYLLGSEALLVDKDIELNPNLKIGAVGSYVHVAKNLKHV